MSTVREQTIAAVEKAMDESMSPDFQWWESSEERLTVILDAAEPIIRADERRQIEMAKAIDIEEVKDGIADVISDCFLSDPTLTAKGYEVAVACRNIAREWKP